MNNEKALIGLTAAALGVGFVIGRKNKRAAAMQEWSRDREIALIQHELQHFMFEAQRDPNMTQRKLQEGINERLDFLNTIIKL